MPPEAAAPQGGIHAVEVLERRVIVGIIAVTLALLVLTTGVISQAALGSLEREVLPGMGREVAAVGGNLAAQIERAVELGVPVKELVGVEPFFEAALANRSSLDSIQLVTAYREYKVQRPGRQHQVRDVAIPVQTDAGPIGVLHLGVNPLGLERAATDSKWDIAIVLLVALLTTAEALIFITDRFVGTPLRLVERLATHVAGGDWTVRCQPIGPDAAGRFLACLNALVRRMNERQRHIAWLAGEVVREAPRTAQGVARALAGLGGLRFAEAGLRTEPVPRSPAIARAPLFLYLFAEQLSTSFIPIFANTVYHPGGLVPQTLAVGLPITVFAGVIALASPFGASLAGRLGSRMVLALGCIPAIAGYLMTAQAESVEAFALWRAVTAVGYALITIACQSYLVAAAEDARGGTGQRGRSMAVFVYAAMTGALCGTAIGAVLADRVGYRATFCISAGLTLCAGLLALQTMDRMAGRRAQAGAAVQRVENAGENLGGTLGQALRTPRFLALIVFAAVPAKLVLSGFVFYIAPLFLHALGDSQPEIGRQVMLYALTMLLTIRAGAWTADRMGIGPGSIALAGLLTGAGLLMALVLPVGVAVPLAIVVTGLCQGLASAPMLAVVPELCPGLAQRVGTATLYGYLRFAERIGSILGPMLAATLAGLFGFAVAMAVIGAVSLVATLGYWAVGARGTRA